MQNEHKKQSAYKIEIFEKTVLSLERMLACPITEERAEVGASVMRFKIAFEAAWKALKVVLFEVHGIDVRSPRAVLQDAFQQQLIDDEEVWVAMLKDRNEITHVYDEKTADHIYQDIQKTYFFGLKKTMLSLKEKFAVESSDRGA